MSQKDDILIVEDSLTQALKLQDTLEQHDYRVAVVNNGMEAVKHLKEHKPSIVISDINMPVMDGYELCQHIKSRDDLKDIPVILLTTFSDPEDVLKALESGANNFITKPYDEKSLIARIHNIQLNQELRKSGISTMGIEIYFAGKKHLITSGRMQIIDLLFCTYENAIQKNRELAQVNKQLHQAIELANQMAVQAESGRAEAEQANEALGLEIAERKRAEEGIKEYSERLEEMVEVRTKELRDAQDQLVRQEKLAVMGQLAGGIGHELRNPLGAIKNAAYLVKMVLEEPEAQVKESLEIIEKEVGISERIIASLLDFARPKPPTRVKVDINDVVQEALSRIPVPDNVQVVSQLNKTLPTILADPDQLGRVLGNVSLNAIQAMPEGGRLIVKSEAPGPEWLTVSFTDTGVGMDEETVRKIFEPLFTTKSKGIGLGLALSRLLIEGHSGTIDVKSTVGKGTTFTIRIPINAAGT